MVEAKGSWKTSSGLLDEYEMTIEEAWFGKDANYQNGQATIFIVTGTAELDGEVVEEEKRTFYGVGDGWESPDGGDTVAHGSGRTTFNRNANFGKFINAVVELGDDVLETVMERGETYEAATWAGLRFRFERKEFTFKDRKTGDETTYGVELPVEFLGVDDGDAKKKAPAKKAPAKSAAKPASSRRRSKKADEEEAEAEPEAKPAAKRRRSTKKADDGGLRDAVIQFAAEWEDHASFMDAVLDPDEFDRAEDVQGNEELLNEVLDAEGEIWEKSREIEPE